MKRKQKKSGFFPIYQIWADYMMKAIELHLKPQHLALYTALLYLCNENFGRTKIQVSKDRLQSLSRILSENTYYKCLNDLETNGFIKRTPGKNGQVCAIIELLFGGENRSDSYDAGIDNDLMLIRCHFFSKKETEKISPSQGGRAKIVDTSLVWA